MWIWFAIPLGVGIVAVFIAVAWHGSTERIYVGIVERGLAMGTDHDSLQVRAYVEETLVHELPAPSKLIGRMFHPRDQFERATDVRPRAAVRLAEDRAPR